MESIHGPTNINCEEVTLVLFYRTSSGIKVCLVVMDMFFTILNCTAQREPLHLSTSKGQLRIVLGKVNLIHLKKKVLGKVRLYINWSNVE